MRCKINGVLIGSIHRHAENSKGEKIEWRQVSVHIPGELEANIIKVPRELDDFDGRQLYQPVYLIVNLRGTNDKANYEARVVKVCKDENELNDTDLYFDDPQVSGYIASMAAGAKSSKAQA